MIRKQIGSMPMRKGAEPVKWFCVCCEPIRVKAETVNKILKRRYCMDRQKIRPGCDDTAYERLGNAIILQAVKDYRAAIKAHSKNPNSISANRDISDVERFFHSGWFGILTSIDGEMLIRELRKGVV